MVSSFLLLAMTGSLVRFDLCSGLTGLPVESMNEGGIVVENPVWLSPEMVTAVVGVQGKTCTLIQTPNNRRLFVRGTVKQVSCKLQGGPNCE